MNEAPNFYPKAPVVEAVIDIQVVLGSEADTALAALAKRLSDRFPEKKSLQQVKVDLQPQGTSFDRRDVGWRLSSAANDRILQLRRQGFTYSHMSPYTQWSAFSSEAKSLWQEFLDTCHPSKITRIAVRYINRIALPTGRIDIRDYFQLYAHVPEQCEPLSGFMIQVQAVHKQLDSRCRSIVTLASEPNVSGQPEKASFLLDIDVFVDRPFEVSNGAFWSLIEQLRHRKNEVFESIITERLRSTFR